MQTDLTRRTQFGRATGIAALGLATCLLITACSAADDAESGSTNEAAPAPTTTVGPATIALDAANTYVQALREFDAAQVIDLLSPSVVLNVAPPADNADQLQASFDYLATQGFEFTGDCGTPTTLSDTTQRVTCELDFTSRLGRAMEYGPVTSGHTFTVTDGLISEVTIAFDQGYSDTVFQAFMAFLDKQPGAFNEIWEDSTSGLIRPHNTPESLAALDRLISEFEASLR